MTTCTVLTTYMQNTLPLGNFTWFSVRLSPSTRGPQPGYRGRLTLLNSLRYKSRTGKSQRVTFFRFIPVQQQEGYRAQVLLTAVAVCYWLAVAAVGSCQWPLTLSGATCTTTMDHIQKDIQPNVKLWMTVDSGAI